MQNLATARFCLYIDSPLFLVSNQADGVTSRALPGPKFLRSQAFNLT